MKFDFPVVEGVISSSVQWLRLMVESVGATIIAIGVLVAAWSFIRSLLAWQAADFNRIRISFARYLALALEFQLGADILSTAIAPTWEAIGKLGAIAIIRTALNFFLMREMQDEREHSQSIAATPSGETNARETNARESIAQGAASDLHEKPVSTS